MYNNFSAQPLIQFQLVCGTYVCLCADSPDEEKEEGGSEKNVPEIKTEDDAPDVVYTVRRSKGEGKAVTTC